VSAALVAGVVLALAVLAGADDPAGRLRRLAGGRSPARPDAVTEPDEALLLDLVAAALLSGAPAATALQVAGAAAGGVLGAAARDAGGLLLLGAPVDEAWGSHPGLVRLRRCLTLSTRSGVPAVPVLRAAADTARRDAHRALEVAAGRLGVRLALPLGLCAVPAFVAWGVVPVVLSLAAEVVR
jgi:hypothetical protein